MNSLTIEAIRENPWNAVWYPLPAFPSPLLLVVIYTAADYCRQSEILLARAAHDGKYVQGDRRNNNGVSPGADSARRVEKVNERIREILKYCDLDGSENVLRY